MRIDIISCLPALLESPLAHSIVGRARAQRQVAIHLHDLRAYGLGRYRQIDDAPYGGQAGMVLMAPPIARCIEALQEERSYDQVIYLTPDGQRLTQPLANALCLQENLLLLCGHYKGIDERIRELYITQEISIGDYVLSGGELPAAVLVDALVRLLPGVLSDGSSALSDSFQDGLIAPPLYTRPALFKGLEVPPLLRSGHHQEIEAWAHAQSLARTQKHQERQAQESMPKEDTAS